MYVAFTVLDRIQNLLESLPNDDDLSQIYREEREANRAVFEGRRKERLKQVSNLKSATLCQRFNLDVLCLFRQSCDWCLIVSGTEP